MQTIEHDGLYVARWGVYCVKLSVSRGVTRVEVRIEDAGPPLAVLPDLPCHTPAEAIQWAAREIEAAGGAHIMIEGRRQRLIDFLRFERVDADVLTPRS